MSSMDGALPRRPGKPNRKGLDRKIYIGWIAIVWVAIISGFGLDFGRYMAEEPGPPAILHIHASVYVVWLVLVSVQIFLSKPATSSGTRRWDGPPRSFRPSWCRWA